MATKQRLEQEISDLEQELDEANSRVEELEGTLASIGDQADESLPEEDEKAEEE